MFLPKTACKAREEREDLPLFLYPGLSFFGGLRLAMDYTYHMCCTVAVKRQAKSFLLHCRDLLWQSKQTWLDLHL